MSDFFSFLYLTRRVLIRLAAFEADDELLVVDAGSTSLFVVPRLITEPESCFISP